MQQAGGVVHDLHELWTKADGSGTGPTKFPHHEHLGLTANGPTELAVELASQLLVLGEHTNALVTALRARAGTAARLTFADELEFVGAHLVEPILIAIVSGDRRVKSLKRVDMRGAKPVLAAEAIALFEGGTRLVAVDPQESMRAALFTRAAKYGSSPGSTRARRMCVLAPSRAAALMAEVDRALESLPP